jgi:hypothetical protein
MRLTNDLMDLVPGTLYFKESVSVTTPVDQLQDDCRIPERTQCRTSRVHHVFETGLFD